MKKVSVKAHTRDFPKRKKKAAKLAAPKTARKGKRGKKTAQTSLF